MNWIKVRLLAKAHQALDEIEQSIANGPANAAILHRDNSTDAFGIPKHAMSINLDLYPHITDDALQAYNERAQIDVKNEDSRPRNEFKQEFCRQGGAFVRFPLQPKDSKKLTAIYFTPCFKSITMDFNARGAGTSQRIKPLMRNMGFMVIPQVDPRHVSTHDGFLGMGHDHFFLRSGQRITSTHLEGVLSMLKAQGCLDQVTAVRIHDWFRINGLGGGRWHLAKPKINGQTKAFNGKKKAYPHHAYQWNPANSVPLHQDESFDGVYRSKIMPGSFNNGDF